MIDKSDTIGALRQQIDEIDHAIIEHIIKRFQLVEKVGQAKKTNMTSIFRPGREAIVVGQLSDGMPPQMVTLIRIIWRGIIATALAKEKPNFTIAHTPYVTAAAEMVSCGQLHLCKVKQPEEALLYISQKKADIAILSNSDIYQIRDFLGPEKQAMIIAKPCSTIRKWRGWIIGDSPPDKTDFDHKVIFNKKTNKIELARLSDYQDNKQYQILGIVADID